MENDLMRALSNLRLLVAVCTLGLMAIQAEAGKFKTKTVTTEHGTSYTNGCSGNNCTTAYLPTAIPSKATIPTPPPRTLTPPPPQAVTPAATSNCNGTVCYSTTKTKTVSRSSGCTQASCTSGAKASGCNQATSCNSASYGTCTSRTRAKTKGSGCFNQSGCYSQQTTCHAEHKAKQKGCCG